MLVGTYAASLEREAKSCLTDRTQPKCSCPVQTWNVIIAQSEGIPTLLWLHTSCVGSAAVSGRALGRLSQALGPCQYNKTKVEVAGELTSLNSHSSGNWSSDKMSIVAHCKCMLRGEHHIWQDRLSGVASLTNPAGCNQLMKAKQIPKQIARAHKITLWIKRPCYLNTSGNDLTSSCKFSESSCIFWSFTSPLIPGV